MTKRCKVILFWDEEAEVWVATSEDIPGLVLEHSSFDVMVERVRIASPELLELNCGYIGDVYLEFSISHCERLAING